MKDWKNLVLCLYAVGSSTILSLPSTGDTRHDLPPERLRPLTRSEFERVVTGEPLFFPASKLRSHDPDSGVEMIGKPAPTWTFDRWLRTKPLSLSSLRGKVVLVRWWT